MNGKNLNVRYRRNAYAKKRIKVIIAIAAGVLGILLILFLVFGGFLKERVDEDREEDRTRESTDTSLSENHAIPPSVNGYGISLSGLTSSSVSDSMAQIAKNGGSCVTFVARNSSGSEIYASAVAQGMGKQSSSSGYIAIDTVASRAANRGLSASAVLPITAFGEKDDLERSVLLAYDAAICAELCREGADEVLVMLSGAEVNEKNIDELARFAENVKAIESEAVIGISLKKDMLEAEGSEVLVSKLWEKYDFLAFDITEIEGEEDPTEFAEENVNSEMHYYLLRYNMRVLLPNVDTDVLEGMVSVLSDKGLNNWQTVVK